MCFSHNFGWQVLCLTLLDSFIFLRNHSINLSSDLFFIIIHGLINNNQAYRCDDLHAIAKSFIRVVCIYENNVYVFIF